MWEIINLSLLALEIILAITGVLFVFRRKNAFKTFVYFCAVFLLNFGIYLLPAIYDIVECGKSVNIFYFLIDDFAATTKQFVGEAELGLVEEYSANFSSFIVVFLLGFLLAIVTTSYAAISTFGRKIINAFYVAIKLNKDSCDIIVGNSNASLNYAKEHRNSILVIGENVDKSAVTALVNDGYTVIHRTITSEFLNSRYFNVDTRYNIIFPNNNGSYVNDINTVVSYLDAHRKNKNLYFYIETDSKVTETLQLQIDRKEKEYGEFITLFSGDELIARTFVEAYPITRFLPNSYLNADTSVKDDVKLNVYMIGYSDIGKELYKQSVINNQLSVYKDGEYRVFPLNYYIYDANVEENEWGIKGLEKALKEFSDGSFDYFPMPDMPYRTQCVREGFYGYDCIKKIAESVEVEKSFSYIIVDTGNVYENIKIGETFKILLDGYENYRIFVYNNSSHLTSSKDIISFGAEKNIYTHDVIVNESLTHLAKGINKEYLVESLGADANKYTPEEIDRQNEIAWHGMSYFNIYSNVYLANNLRLKLNLLGIDYIRDGKAQNIDLVNKMYGEYDEKEKLYENYFAVNKRNALLAQEHFRWNAYHLMLGYLPMKKSRIIVEKASHDSDRIKKVIKNNSLKKHACLTTFNGLDKLSEFLASKSNEVIGTNLYSAKDFDYYVNDEMLFSIAPKYLGESKISLYKKQ